MDECKLSSLKMIAIYLVCCATVCSHADNSMFKTLCFDITFRSIDKKKTEKWDSVCFSECSDSRYGMRMGKELVGNNKGSKKLHELTIACNRDMNSRVAVWKYFYPETISYDFNIPMIPSDSVYRNDSLGGLLEFKRFYINK